jgi:hypothetical protein
VEEEMSEKEEKKPLMYRATCSHEEHGEEHWRSRWTPTKDRVENVLRNHLKATGHQGKVESSTDPFNTAAKT